ncbi:MAG: NAD(P)H-quinone oxidoreductase [Alphaproteobacteria bacterium]
MQYFRFCHQQFQLQTMLPTTHHAIHISQYGAPSVLLRQATPMPSPQQGEVLIKTAYAGINRADCLQRRGKYPAPAGASPILGLEVSGQVVAIGGGVDSSWLGKNVCALLAGGGYADYVNASTDLCLEIPASLSLQQAAALPEALFTIAMLLIETAKVKQGETLFFHGGSSGIGSLMIQLAKLMGLRVIVTAGSEEKTARCLSLGADTAINYRQPEAAHLIQQAASKEGIDVVVDMMGGHWLAQHLSWLNPCGRHVSFAVQGGHEAHINLITIMQKKLQLTGCTLRARPLLEKIALAAMVKANFWPWILKKQAQPIIDTVFDATEAVKAHEKMESGQHFGKIILCFAGNSR